MSCTAGNAAGKALLRGSSAAVDAYNLHRTFRTMSRNETADEEEGAHVCLEKVDADVDALEHVQEVRLQNERVARVVEHPGRVLQFLEIISMASCSSTNRS